MLLSLLLGWLFQSCSGEIERGTDLLEYIPPQTEAVWKIGSWNSLKADVSSNELLGNLEGMHISEIVKDKERFLFYLKSDRPAMLCMQQSLDSMTHFTYLSNDMGPIFHSDSIPEAVVDTIKYKQFSLQKVSIDESDNFLLRLDSVQLISTSEQILKQVLDQGKLENMQLQKAILLSEEDELTAIYPAGKQQILASATHDMADLSSIKLQLLPNGLTANGVMFTQDSIPQLLNIFQGLKPQVTQLTSFIPSTADRVISMSYDDKDLLEQNWNRYTGDSLSLPAFFGSTNELAYLGVSNGDALVFHSLDPDLTRESLSSQITSAGEYKETEIYRWLGKDSISFGLQKIFPEFNIQYALELDEFFAFTSDLSIAEELITAYKNNATLQNNPYYLQAQNHLAQASSMTVYHLKGELGETFTKLLGASNSSVSGFPIGVVQYSYDRNFAHVNMVCLEAEKSVANTGVVSQLFSTELDADVLGNPQFFSNHRTGGKDIVVQDIQNKLYLISSSGKIVWKKQLDGAVIGPIQEVDLLRNRKKQLAFVTKNTFYILDRNGNQVKPFPIKYKDDITQPLSVFDYDNNRKYRFVVTQDNRVYMYDNKAKIVQGFGFKGTDSRILFPPKHIRMNNKDYILIAEDNGKLQILSRVGKIRVPLDETFKFSEVAPTKENNKFVVISSDPAKFSISQIGNVESQNLEVSDAYGFQTLGAVKVTLDDNLLRINGKLIELPFGLYSETNIHQWNGNTYISVTEMQEKKLYLFRKNGDLLNGFPIYGSSTLDLGDATKNKRLNILSKGGAKEVILYEVQ